MTNYHFSTIFTVIILLVSLILTMAHAAQAATNTTTTTTMAAATPAPTTTSTTVTGVVPAQRPTQRYYLKLAGASWNSLLRQANTTSKLREALRYDLASRFYTTNEYISIYNMSVGSLIVDFGVSPDGDGTQIRENTFLQSTEDDTAWLAQVIDLYATVSSERIRVLNTRYANTGETQPPVHTSCSTRCLGAMAGGFGALFVVTVFLLVAWRQHVKEKDWYNRHRLFGGVAMQQQGFDDDDGETLKKTTSSKRTSKKNVVVTRRTKSARGVSVEPIHDVDEDDEEEEGDEFFDDDDDEDNDVSVTVAAPPPAPALPMRSAANSAASPPRPNAFGVGGVASPHSSLNSHATASSSSAVVEVRRPTSSSLPGTLRQAIVPATPHNQMQQRTAVATPLSRSSSIVNNNQSPARNAAAAASASSRFVGQQQQQLMAPPRSPSPLKAKSVAGNSRSRAAASRASPPSDGKRGISPMSVSALGRRASASSSSAAAAAAPSASEIHQIGVGRKLLK